MITVEATRYGHYLVTDLETEDTVLVQSDYEFPGLARAFGWSPSRAAREDDCQCRGTDGTVTCPDCGSTAGDYISSAADYLDGCEGATVEDPGYF